MKGLCISCKKEKETSAYGKSKGMCHSCYKRLLWRPKKKICKRCKRLIPLHAKGLCAGCYNSLFNLENIRVHNAKNYHNIDEELYKQVSKECVACGFDKIVELHHLDHNKKNNSKENFIGLCPNCHRMLHSKNYQRDIFKILK